MTQLEENALVVQLKALMDMIKDMKSEMKAGKEKVKNILQIKVEEIEGKTEKITMKRVAPLASTNASVKKVCFFKDSKKDSSFKPDAVPENHFHLGRSNYAIVSDFADVARIHLRQYKLDATGSLFPTKS
ncbi:PC4 domain-containing protein [Nephila pilipes]|uniref:PC4 domain-containing protein n=1 Tax=Nephila pilipes TaxID=299642 RepID=A0A8X6UIT3_NEPPI|nr:PC4 domain-containing protein [Nephila pilipes]